MRPTATPIGLQLARTARLVSRAFGAALAEAGGSVPMFQVLSNLMNGERATQQELARSLDIEGPTLTRHLDGLERAGLVERRRDPNDRRAVQVELTDAGRELHTRLRKNVVEFDERLRSGLAEDDLDRVRTLLTRLEQNVRNEEGKRD
jgi:MarR family transcriptional regulator for hemolysin